MEILLFLGGAVLGSVLTRFIMLRKTGYGYFKLESNDPENPEIFDLTVGFKQGQYLLDKRQIILKRDKSQQ